MRGKKGGWGEEEKRRGGEEREGRRMKIHTPTEPTYARGEYLPAAPLHDIHERG